MNITFLIGNGFDRNLGLKTAYSDFVRYYKNIPASSATLENFRRNINDDEELWVDAEIAIGQYTGKLQVGEGAVFAECHTDFCEQLARYLKEQMVRIDYDDSHVQIMSAFENLNNIVSSFPTQERKAILTLYENRKGEPFVFNFVCYNYTDTLDQCLAVVGGTQEGFGSHKYGSKTILHSMGNICHVHGTVDKEMVFGVNDDLQIANTSVFDCEDGDLYKNLLIKVQTNASFLENTDEIAARMIASSHIVYIYGMSIGETDKLWWDRICQWLSASKERHLIVHQHGMPPKSVTQMRYQLAERKAKRAITNHSSLEDTKKQNIESQIHITGDNLFAPIAGIAKDESAVDELHDDTTTVELFATNYDDVGEEIVVV